MKSRKYIAKWLMVTLIMAIGIGTFAALTISNEKDKETSEAKSSTYLTNQRQKDIDMKELKKMLGEYQADDDEGFWHLSVSEDFDDKGPYLSVSDNGAGNPGFEGRIMYLKDGIVIVEIDEDLYEGMPEGWEPEGEGKYAILDYEIEDDGMELGYRGKEVEFDREQ